MDSAVSLDYPSKLVGSHRNPQKSSTFCCSCEIPRHVSFSCIDRANSLPGAVPLYVRARLHWRVGSLGRYLRLEVLRQSWGQRYTPHNTDERSSQRISWLGSTKIPVMLGKGG